MKCHNCAIAAPRPKRAGPTERVGFTKSTSQRDANQMDYGQREAKHEARHHSAASPSRHPHDHHKEEKNEGTDSLGDEPFHDSPNQ